MITAADLESRTQAYGREIFARLDRGKLLPFSAAWWDERLMALTIGDEAIKVQLFRFIDVLPQLRTPLEINRHLAEYFAEAAPHLPGWQRFLLRLMPQRGLLGRLLARAARGNAERLARRFIAGSNVSEALEAIAKLRRRSLAFTVDLLGEATITEAEADRCRDEYLELIRGLAAHVNAWKPIDLIDRDDAGPLPRVNVSVKLSSLYSQFDPLDYVGTARAVLARLRPILRAARQQRAFVNFDMEQYAYKDATLRIFKEVLTEAEFRDWPDVGIAIQCYLRECAADLEALHAWAAQRGTPVWVRLIKGAYWDFETVNAAQQGWPTPVFTHKHETDANFERLARFLLERHETLRPAFGSHNVRSLAFVMGLAEDLGLPNDGYEIQMLYGMAEPIKDVLASLGRRVRVYTPYGQLLPGMAYLVRRLLENTANESFLRASFTEHVPEDVLLMNPLQKQGVAGVGGHAAGDGHALQVGSWSGTTSAAFANEPLVDFSQEANRVAMQKALDRVGDRLGKFWPLVIGGETVQTAEPLDVGNPSHIGQIVGRCGRAKVGDAERAVAAAKAAFPAWRDTAIEDRVGYLTRAAEVMRQRRFELAAWEVHESAKQWREADADVAEAIDFCEYYAREMRRLGPPSHRDVPGETNAYFYEPRGVAVVIAPWNFPLAILCGMTTAALAAGNTVVMKPAEQSSVIAALMMEIFQGLKLPPGVLNYLPGVGEEIGPTLVSHPDVAVIAFTGSRQVGVYINQQAAEMPAGQYHFKKVIAEMGGKNAIIIDDDADLDEAVHGVTGSAFGYQGQKCSACSRVIALEGIHDAFLNRLVEATRSLRIAPAEDPGSVVGPVIDETARRRLHDAIERGKSEARLVHAGEVGALGQEGYYVAPHIFADVAPTSFLAQDEFFGPILAVLKARDLDHALEIANGTPYALTGGIYSRSPKNIAQVKRQFRVGNLYINRKITGALVDRQPFGGFKMSGTGSKAGGVDYLLQFLLPRTITENTMRRGFAPDQAGE
ncbi:MAG: L-glutamate gamma-semialdehyde dehydrogenase [Planctomycetia bacterium]|nr:L-glutamate gamma-semialdehyde dehydrogenase [Planctomycetia bacterium]